MVDIVSAEDMYNAIKSAKDADIIIKAAAAADYRPSEVSDEKRLRKKMVICQFLLSGSKDIIGTLEADKRDGLFLCGFSMKQSIC